MEAPKSWTQAGLRPNVVYLIKNPLSGRYLRGNDGEAEQVGLTMNLRGPDYHGDWLYWYFEANSDGTVIISNTWSQRYLRCDDRGDEQIHLTVAKRGLEYHGDWLHWKLISLGDDKYLIQNPLSGRYLRADNNQDEAMTPTAAKRGFDYHGDWLIWTITPASSTFNVKVTQLDYKNTDDIIKNSGGKIKRVMVGLSQLEVDQHTVDTTITQGFKKTITETFNYQFTQTYGITAGLEFEASIPFVGSAKTKIEAKAEWGINKSTGGQTSHEIEVSVSCKPSTPGKYRLSGWVDIIDNIEFPFTAKATFTAKGLGFKNGKLEKTHDLSSIYIENIMRASKDYNSLDVLSRTETSLTVEVRGIMVGTYGLKTSHRAELIK